MVKHALETFSAIEQRQIVAGLARLERTEPRRYCDLAKRYKAIGCLISLKDGGGDSPDERDLCDMRFVERLNSLSGQLASKTEKRAEGIRVNWLASVRLDLRRIGIRMFRFEKPPAFRKPHENKFESGRPSICMCRIRGQTSIISLRRVCLLTLECFTVFPLISCHGTKFFDHLLGWH